jgi:tRNA dimethylallyltransferase
MKQRLEIAIHQFAKRQATWFRKMEKEGFQINWIEADDTFENIYNSALNIITSKISTAH